MLPLSFRITVQQGPPPITDLVSTDSDDEAPWVPSPVPPLLYASRSEAMDGLSLLGRELLHSTLRELVSMNLRLGVTTFGEHTNLVFDRSTGGVVRNKSEAFTTPKQLHTFEHLASRRRVSQGSGFRCYAACFQKAQVGRVVPRGLHLERSVLTAPFRKSTDHQQESLCKAKLASGVAVFDLSQELEPPRAQTIFYDYLPSGGSDTRCVLPQGCEFRRPSQCAVIRQQRLDFLQQQLDSTRQYLREKTAGADPRSLQAVVNRHLMLLNDFYCNRSGVNGVVVQCKNGEFRSVNDLWQPGCPEPASPLKVSADTDDDDDVPDEASTGALNIPCRYSLNQLRIEFAQHVDLQSSKLFTRSWCWKLKAFHRGPNPVFDHFQLKNLTVAHSRSKGNWRSEGVGVYYFQQISDQNKDAFGYVPSDFTRECWRISSRTAVFHHDLQNSRTTRVLGPWNYKQGNNSSHIALESQVLYSLDVSKDYIAIANGCSSVLVAKKVAGSDIAIAWGICRRVPEHPQQIINSLLLIQDEKSPHLPIQEVRLKMLREQAREKGIRKFKNYCCGFESVLKRVIESAEVRMAFIELRKPMLIEDSGLWLNRQTPADDGHFSSATSSPFIPRPTPAAADRDIITHVGREDHHQTTRAPQHHPFFDVTASDESDAPGDENSESDGEQARSDYLLEEGRSRPHNGTGNKKKVTLRCNTPWTDANDLMLITAGNDRCVCEFRLVFSAVTEDIQQSIHQAQSIFYRPNSIGSVLWTEQNLNEPMSATSVLPELELQRKWNFPFCINHAALHPDHDLLLLVGDNPSPMILSRREGAMTNDKFKKISYLERLGRSDGSLGGQYYSRPLYLLEAHQDCGFACDWHPGGYLCATGNDDETVAIWDLRRLSAPVRIFPTEATSCRTLKFSDDGEFLVSCESEETCVIYSTRSNFETKQVVPFFGACVGASFTSDSLSLIIGISDPKKHGGLMELTLR